MAGEENGRIVVLCERLLQATRERTAEWNRDSQDLYVWAGGQGSVAIGSRDRDGEPPYQLTVLNPDGEPLEELRSDLVADDQPAPWNDALAELYRVARRRALRTDEVVEALIESVPR